MYAVPIYNNISAILPENYKVPSRLHDLLVTLNTDIFPWVSWGHISGDYPAGISTLEGVPTSADITVLTRAPGMDWDAMPVRRVKSGDDGVWRAEGIDPGLRYRVIADKQGYNSVISDNIKPANIPRLIPETYDITIAQDTSLLAMVVGGAGDITTTHVGGQLPEGVSFTDSRFIGSWPTGAPGEYILEFQLVDEVLTTNLQEITINLELLPLYVSPVNNLPKSFALNESIIQYSWAASGGESPYTLSSSGSLPPGISFDPSTGAISGTPTSTGEYSSSIMVTDVRGNTASHEFNVAILEPLELFDTNLALHKPYDSDGNISLQNSSSGPNNGDKNTKNYTGLSNGEKYLSIDLLDIYSINQINLWLYFSDGRTYFDKRVQHSLDGTVWTTVFDSAIDGSAPETSSGIEVKFNTDSARFIRVITNGSTSNRGNHVVEMEAYLKSSP